MKYLNSAQLESFKENGFLILPPQFSEPELAALREASFEAIEKAGPQTHENPRLQIEPDSLDGKPVVRKVEPISEHVPAFRELITDKRICGPLSDLFAEEPVIFEEKLNYKFPRVGTSYYMHQDYSYWKQYTEIPSDRLITTFVYLDDFTEENGAIQLLVGSHKGGLLPWVEGEPHHVKWNQEGEKLFTAVGKAGTILFFDAYTAHQSGHNHSLNPRRACIFTYNPRSVGSFYPNKELRDRLAGLIPNQ